MLDDTMNLIVGIKPTIDYDLMLVFSAPTFSAKLFLDCCGLVRKVLKDLMEEFGFSIGPWNQAYMVVAK